ncbi:MAG: hypothetical protein JNN16_19415 [Nitrospira sp.]|nr:hypothetical protein [Nitrospira sp.]
MHDVRVHPYQRFVTQREIPAEVKARGVGRAHPQVRAGLIDHEADRAKHAEQQCQLNDDQESGECHRQHGCQEASPFVPQSRPRKRQHQQSVLELSRLAVSCTKCASSVRRIPGTATSLGLVLLHETVLFIQYGYQGKID